MGPETVSLATNALSTILYNDVAIDEKGNPASLTFTRRQLPRNFIKPTMLSGQPDFIPPKPPSNLSGAPTEDLELRVTYKRGGVIGTGHCGSVHAVKSPTIRGSPELPPLYVPPLVVKIAARRRKTFLAREAWFYDEMESLQGIVIPRCYGCFVARLPKSWKFRPWREDDEDRFRYTKQELRTALDVRGAFVDTDSDSHALLELIENERYIMLLVLERCGKPFLPVYDEIPRIVQQHVYNAYDDIAKLGIEHGDIRYANILKAPKSPPGLPSIASPYTHRTYDCRIIDFELARKVNASVKSHRINFGGWLRGVIANLPYGDFAGQNEI